MIYCEQCGEQEQEVTFKDAGLCGDCATETFRVFFADFWPGEICGQPIFGDKGIERVCVIPFGIEHDHG